MVSRRTGGGEESLEAKVGQENELDSPPPACTLQIRSGRAIFPLPPAALCREPPTQGHFCFKFLHSVTNRILSPVLVMLTSPNTGVFYRSLSLSKMAISDNLKTCKPETGCNSSVQRVAADMTFRNPESESDFHFPSPELVRHSLTVFILYQEITGISFRLISWYSG